MIRRSSDAIEIARAASPRSWASMNRSSRTRSSALGSRADQSARRGGEVGLHGRPGTLEGAVDGDDRRVERRRRLAGRPVEDVAGDQRRALARRQELESGEEGERDRLALDDDRVGFVGARGDLVEQAVGIGRQPRDLDERPRPRSPGGRSAATCRDRRWSRSCTATLGRASCRRTCRAPATPAGRSPGPRPRPRRTRRASGSSGRGARAGIAR